MGFNGDTFTRIFLGIGLGILAVSCLTVTIVFGRYANSFTKYEKYEAKLSFDSKSSMIDSSIAIAVLGCISAVLALVAIVLSFFIDRQSLALIIIGGISSLFAFGCMIAEGVYSQESYFNLVLDKYDDIQSHSHKSARNYIKKSIKSLYEQALKNFRDTYGDRLANSYMPSWSSVNKQLGKLHPSKYVLTYNNLWPDSASYTPLKEIPIFLYISNYIIKAKHLDGFEVPVAVSNFKVKYSSKPSLKVCWYKNDKTSLECKKFKGDKNEAETSVSATYPSLNEYIVVGDYYSDLKEKRNLIVANYYVGSFPFAFKTLPVDAFDVNGSIPAVDGDTRHYKVSGSNWAKACYEEKDYESDSFLLAPSKPSSYQNAIDMCSSYNQTDDLDDLSMCEFDTELDDISEVISYYYKDSAKGKVPPYFKKYYKSYYKSVFSNMSPYPGLYVMAIINLIIQIFAIIIWACGVFMPSGSDKFPSEGEA